jgi:hypothetical protein
MVVVVVVDYNYIVVVLVIVDYNYIEVVLVVDMVLEILVVF